MFSVPLTLSEQATREFERQVKLWKIAKKDAGDFN